MQISRNDSSKIRSLGITLGVMVLLLAVVVSKFSLFNGDTRSRADVGTQKPITGTFFQVDNGIFNTESALDAMMKNMSDSGLDTIIVYGIGSVTKDVSGYHTKDYLFSGGASLAIPKLAKKYGMTIYYDAVGNNNSVDPFTGDPNDPNSDPGHIITYAKTQIPKLKQMLAAEGISWDDPVIGGFYIPQESGINNLWNPTTPVMNFYSAYSKAIKVVAPTKKIILSPWMTDQDNYAAAYNDFTKVFQYTSVDILAPQDSVGSGKVTSLTNDRIHFQALHDAVSKFPGKEGWANIESFTGVTPSGDYTPTSITALQGQIVSAKPYVSKIITWIYQHTLLTDPQFDNLGGGQYTPLRAVERQKLHDAYWETYMYPDQRVQNAFVYGQNLVTKGKNFGPAGAPLTLQITYLTTGNIVQRRQITTPVVKESDGDVLYVSLAALPGINTSQPITVALLTRPPISSPTNTPTPTIQPTQTPAPSCIPMYYCRLSDKTCLQTSSTYNSQSQTMCGGPGNCVGNLKYYLSGKTTEQCFTSLSSCQQACR